MLGPILLPDIAAPVWPSEDGTGDELFKKSVVKNNTDLKTGDLNLHHLKLHLLDCLRVGTEERVHVHANGLLLSESIGRTVYGGGHWLLHAVGGVSDVEILSDHICQLVFLLLNVVIMGMMRVTRDLESGTWSGGVGNV